MKAFLPIFLFLVCSSVHAATNIDPRVAKYDTCGRFEVYHVNGVLTEETDAGINLDQIRVSYGNAYKEHLIKYLLAYNQSIGVKSDFLDAAKQIISTYVGATWEKWQNAVMFGVYDVGLPATTAAAIAKKVTEMFAFLKPSPYQDSDLFYINAAIRSTTQSGARKLFVCHSQGNLYCNLVYDQLVAGGTAPQTMGVVGVAVPTFSLRTGNNYTTSSNDLVIDAVRIAQLTLGNVLTPTVTIPWSPLTDPLGHKLVPTYLSNSTAKAQIVANMTTEFGTLKSVFPAVRYPQSVYYNSVQYSEPHCSGVGADQSGVVYPPCSKYWPPVAPYDAREFVIVMPTTLAAATSVTLANAKTCYSMAVAGIKKAQLARPSTSSWAWFTMGYPNNYGCWDMISGNPATDYRAGAWWLYGGDAAPQWRATYDRYSSNVTSEGAAVCKI